MKRNEIFKIVGASVLSIAMLCAVFIAGNEVVFAHAASQTLSLPNISAPPVQDASAADYPHFELTVNELVMPRVGSARAPGPPRRSDLLARNVNTISPEEAAQIGARYVYDIFGVNICGSFVTMFYITNDFGVRNYWHGFVSDSEWNPRREVGELSFHIDSVSGRRVSISDTRDRGVVSGTGSRSEVEIIPFALPSNLYYFEELATTFAEAHFNLTEVVRVEFSAGAPGRRIHGVTTTEPRIEFVATDNFGREASIQIAMQTSRLLGICSQFSDFIPGFVSADSTPVPNAPAGTLPSVDSPDDISRIRQEGVTPEEAEAIRNNPNHPLCMEMFGRVWNDPSHPRHAEWFGHMRQD